MKSLSVCIGSEVKLMLTAIFVFSWTELALSCLVASENWILLTQSGRIPPPLVPIVLKNNHGSAENGTFPRWRS